MGSIHEKNRGKKSRATVPLEMNLPFDTDTLSQRPPTCSDSKPLVKKPAYSDRTVPSLYSKLLSLQNTLLV
jgi:hypothetical protein